MRSIKKYRYSNLPKFYYGGQPMGIDMSQYDPNNPLIPVQQGQMSTPQDAPKISAGSSQIPGVIGSIIGIGRAIGEPIKANAERTNISGGLVSEHRAANAATVGSFLDPMKTFTSTFGDKDATSKEKWGAGLNLLLPGMGAILGFGKARAKRLNEKGIEDTRNAYSEVATNNYSNLINQQLRFAFGGKLGAGNNIVDYKGATHGEGGIEVDSTGTPSVVSGKKGVAETEDKEFSFNGYVFSDKLKYNG
jgi:hypothetical protein